MSFEYVQKPWGGYQDFMRERSHVVKIMDIEPGKRLSLQRHQHRDELWVVIEGEIRITHNDSEKTLKVGEEILFRKGDIHRGENRSNIKARVLETQWGVCDENDIERLQDDYGRG